MGGMAEGKDVVKNETPVASPHTPQTFELRKHGYLALPRNLGSGVYETGLTTQASGGLELFGLQNRDLTTGFRQDMNQGLRQSSIDTEPHTLAPLSMQHAVVCFSFSSATQHPHFRFLAEVLVFWAHAHSAMLFALELSLLRGGYEGDRFDGLQGLCVWSYLAQ